MTKISVLMTVYNEAKFIEYAVRSISPHVDDLVIVEGAYQETIACGANPRSTDGTGTIIARLANFGPYAKKISWIEANEKTDKDQRNIGLEKIKELNPNGWLLIVDGDEVYDSKTLSMVKVLARNMDRQKKLGAYFTSQTFVNDLNHFTNQEFPRLFKITPDCRFTNDNFMEWPDLKINWFSPYVIKVPYIKYFHYAFCKGMKRFELKKKWWETRFGKPFDYGWRVNKRGQIEDDNHKIYEFTGDHPKVMEEHPFLKEK